jgi:iron complex outermembrane receptor protein
MKTKKSPLLAQRISLPVYLSLTASTAAWGQAAVEGHVEDVVVTAPAADTVEAISHEQATAFQSTPQAVSVVTKQQIQDLNITNLLQAQKLAPSLQIKFSNVRNLTVNIRGFGAATSNATDSIFGGVPIYIDGVYQPRPGQAIFDIPDLEGIQVLKGPQSTSGGQDSTGGAVYITTALPSFVAQETAEVSYGNYNYVQVKASATGAIAESDKAAFRLSAFGTDRNGYIYNYNQGQNNNDWHSKGTRGQILLTPTNDLSVRLVFDYSHVNQSCCVSLFNGVVPNYANGAPVVNGFYDRAARVGYTPLPWNALDRYKTDVVGYLQTAQETEGAAAIVDYAFNGFTLNSTSSYRGWDFHPNNRNGNFGGVPLTLNSNGHVSPERSITQNIKISSPKGLPVEGSAGLFFLHENLFNHGLTTYGPKAGNWFATSSAPATLLVYNRALNYLGNQFYDNPETNQIAPFAQGVWHATPNLDIDAGLRYSYSAKQSLFRQYRFSVNDYSGLTPAQIDQVIAIQNRQIGPNREFYAVTRQGLISALASASYKFTPDVMGYVTYSRGGRAGGPNPVANLPLNAKTTVKAEELDNYEVGVKSTFFDGRLQANASAFVMVMNNYITNVTSLVGATPVSYLANAKRAISRGVELDLRARPTDEITAYASFTYDDAYFDSFDSGPCPFEQTYAGGPKSCNFTGKPLSIVPKFAMAVGADYSQRLDPFEAISPKPLVAYVGADFTYQTQQYSEANDSIYSLIPAYGLLNLHAGIRFEDASWDFSVWAHNALDKRYFINLSPALSGGGGGIGGNVGDPLMAGLTLRAKL